MSSSSRKVVLLATSKTENEAPLVKGNLRKNVIFNGKMAWKEVVRAARTFRERHSYVAY